MEISQPPVSDLIPATVLSAQGDIVIRGVASPDRLGIGVAGNLLRVNAGATAPEWFNDIGTTLQVLRTNLAGTLREWVEQTALHNFSSAYIGGAPQNHAAAGLTKLLLDTAQFDVAGNFDAANNRWKPVRAGRYIVCGFQQLGLPAATGEYGIKVYKNAGLEDSNFYTHEVATAKNREMDYFTVIEVNGTTDYIEIKGYNGFAASAVNLNNGLIASNHKLLGPF